MDKLEEIVEMQKKLMDRLKVVSFASGSRDERQVIREEDFPNLAQTVQEQTKNMLHAITCEIGEISDEFNWKPWKKTKKDVDLDLIYNEFIDVFHFIVEIMIMWGMTADDIMKYYKAKNEENHARQDRGY